MRQVTAKCWFPLAIHDTIQPNQRSAKRRRTPFMDLSQKTPENLELMIEGIKAKLRMASGAAMQASAFSLEQYDDIYDVYDIVMNKPNLSISEVEALVSELGRLRNK
jgi:uncharacterized protein YfkK (UPF0435 family)